MGSAKHRGSLFVAGLLVVAGLCAIGVAIAAQQHAPQPSRAAFGSLRPATAALAPIEASASEALPAPSTAGPKSEHRIGTNHGPILRRSDPIAIDIPSIGVRSKIFDVGLNPDGTIQVPPLNNSPLTNEAAWYKYSPTPGALGPSIVEGHIDSAAQGPSVFFRLGATKPGAKIYVTLADGVAAVFQVSGVRQYAKNAFPTSTVYGNTKFAALRLLTCGGRFDDISHHYVDNTVVFAALISSHPLKQGLTNW